LILQPFFGYFFNSIDRLLNRQVGGLVPFENAAGEDAGLAISVGNARAVAYQAAIGDVFELSPNLGDGRGQAAAA
jgi:hypothetical protein